MLFTDSKHLLISHLIPYIYDLAVVTQFRMSIEIIDTLIKHPNIKGMKSANWELIKEIERKYPDTEFNCLYSGLDTFDYANVLGIKKNLDGMFACTLWGTSGIFVHFLSPVGYSSFNLTGVRSVVAFLCMLLYVLFFELKALHIKLKRQAKFFLPKFQRKTLLL